MKYIFIVGGVMSGVGKGVAAASIGRILKSRGFEVTALKIDPYVNIDAGTMNPTEHGEVFVLNDGTECDQDMGNYERFLDCELSKDNYMTTGSVYLSVINQERNLEYGGKCVEVVPHIPLEVIERIDKAILKNKAQIAVIEIGGTVGEYQNILFLEAVRMLKLKNPDSVSLVLVSYLPILNNDSEMKTKPTQYAVRALNSAGLQPDIILARSAIALDKKRKSKIAFNCNIREEDVISAPDVKNIYEVPVNFEKDNLSENILGKLKLKPKSRDLKKWRQLANLVNSTKKSVKIGIVGKYFGSGGFILTDSYISIIEAVKHAAYYFKVKPEIIWLDAEDYEKNPKNLKELSNCDGVIIPGGFGSRAVEGKIAAIKYLREKKISFLGICYGMQLAVVEFARSVAGLKGAHTTEVESDIHHPIIDILAEQKKHLENKNYGATMRLGSYPAAIKNGTIAYSAYRSPLVSERHRHRYEVNPDYIERLEKSGLIFSGFSPDKRLMEIIELPKNKHPFFVASQFHPEFKSHPFKPHPLFREFVRTSLKK
ncbi:CTP synthase [Candidatus Wolfebacteria bacterium]|nr:CTP synthase [Candidatus Wolfebacteria bacterium]